MQDVLGSVPRAQAACPYTRPTGAWKYKSRVYDRSVNDPHQGQCAFWEGSFARRLRFGDMGSGSTPVKDTEQKPGGEKLRPCGFRQVGVKPHGDDAQQKCGRSLSAGAGCYSVVGEGIRPVRCGREIWLAVVLKPF